MKILLRKGASALCLQDIGDSCRPVNVEADLTSSRSGHKVLVLANEPLLAALLGGLVELARFEVAFAKPGELAQDALSRVKPLAAILVEAVNDVAENDLFLALARKKNVEVVLFGSAAALAERSAWAREHGVQAFQLPEDVDKLQASLEKLRNGSQPAGGERTPRLASRRAHTMRDQEGTLIFDDGKGTRWSVYDRRAGDRRVATLDRRFVSSESGVVLHCKLTEEEAAATSVAALSEQLARAEPLSV